MIETMRAVLKGCAALAGLVLLATPSFAADVTAAGEWLVKDRIAKIRIENCAGNLWGVVSWEKEPGGVDKENPDPGKRARPTLGMPILLAMRPSANQPNRWDGEIYNAENGKTYSGNIRLSSPDQLELQGCVLGFLCGGETWTRTAAALPTQKPPATAKPPATRTGTTGAGAAAAVGATKSFDTVRDLCVAVSEATGLPLVDPPAPAPRAGGAPRPAPAPAPR
jgi:uncharacterized protein (DUF2147 family)